MVGLALAHWDNPAGPPRVSNAISNASRAQMVNLLTLPIGRPRRRRLNSGRDFLTCCLVIFALNFVHFHAQTSISPIHLWDGSYMRQDAPGEAIDCQGEM